MFNSDILLVIANCKFYVCTAHVKNKTNLPNKNSVPIASDKHRLNIYIYISSYVKNDSDEDTIKHILNIAKEMYFSLILEQVYESWVIKLYLDKSGLNML